MTKRKQDDQKEARKSLSEWQRRNKEYLEKKAQEEAERQKQLEQEQALAEEKDQKNDESDITDDSEDQEIENDSADETSNLNEEADDAGEENDGFELDEGEELSKKELKRLAKLERDANRIPIEKIHLYRALPVLIINGLLILLSLYFLTPLANIKTILFSGNQMVSQEELLKNSKIDDRDYTLTTFINQKNYARNMKFSNPWIDTVDMTYQFPFTFNVKVKEYGVLGYLHENENYYPILTSGEVIKDVVAPESLPASYISVEFSDRQLIKLLVSQLEKVPDSVKNNIRTVQITPSKVTQDLATLTMGDEHQVLVPISQIARKLPYYEGIQPQLEFPSVVDMEAGIFSYLQGAQNEEPSVEPEEKTEDKIEEAASDDENSEIQNQTENNENAENN
ncbi:cell division protein FtsQ/DivIB [Streptococcus cristatus]|uniref:cell division protein FtsQ/DivIB n=1 Tax=Streptococcus cristatus TaxID=45634 RepID=UPI002283CC13|nr:FtsQ-type POTRA domain-containing protein [Streptococcus cristatus]MCY7217687.1 FtsQ-type POTRA domain-containing protein [Streptococcus cristatus]